MVECDMYFETEWVLPNFIKIYKKDGKLVVTLVPECREIAKQSLNVDSVGHFMD